VQHLPAAYHASMVGVVWLYQCELCWTVQPNIARKCNAPPRCKHIGGRCAALASNVLTLCTYVCTCNSAERLMFIVFMQLLVLWQLVIGLREFLVAASWGCCLTCIYRSCVM
jgi:hypothetical protein